MRWYEHYIGKPWAVAPEPPFSFTCGELARHIYKERLGVDVPVIYADPSRLDQCIANLEEPEAYSLHPLTNRRTEQSSPCSASRGASAPFPDPSSRLAGHFEGPPRPFDIAYMLRRVKRDHLGMAVQTTEGLMILHCMQGVGVILETEAEIMGTTGARRIEWRRHKDVSEELALCRA